MVNIHISSDSKKHFKSKTAIQRLKKFIRDNEDTELVTASEYLNEGITFDFKEEEDNIYVNIIKKDYIWGDGSNFKKPEKVISSKDKLKSRLKELQSIRTGKVYKEMNEIKKTVDKDIYKKYINLQKFKFNIPIPRPDEILNEPDKYKQQIELFGSGLIPMTKNKTVDNAISDYFKTIADKIGFEVLTANEINQRMAQQQQQQQKIVDKESKNLDLSKYVDSDTESESTENDIIENNDVIENNLVEDVVV